MSIFSRIFIEIFAALMIVNQTGLYLSPKQKHILQFALWFSLFLPLSIALGGVS